MYLKATPNEASVDALMALSPYAGSGFADYAAILRFNVSGSIDARNGASYQADQTITYIPGQTFTFRMEINADAHTYDVYVAPEGGAEVQLAKGYAFRTERAAAFELDYFGIFSDQGTQQVCGLSVDGGIPSSSSSSSSSSSTPVPSSCNNGVIERPELCDGANLGGATCTSQGFSSGTLRCSADCMSFDTSQCVSLVETYYVSVSGAGNHNGLSSANAFSLAEALNHSHTNGSREIIYLLAAGNYGDFRDNAGRSAWHTFRAASATKPKFTGIQLVNSQMVDSFLRIDGFEIAVANGAGADIQRARHVSISNSLIYGAVTQPYSTANTTGNCRYLTGDYGCGVAVEASEDITVDRSVVRDFMLGVYFTGAGQRLTNSQVYGIGEDALRLWAAADDSTIKTNVLFENNDVYYVGDAQNCGGGHPDIFQAYTLNTAFNGIIIRGNYFHDSNSQGIFFSGANESIANVTIANNVVDRLTMGCINIGSGHGLTIEHNTTCGLTVARGDTLQETSAIVQRDNLSLYGANYETGADVREWNHFIVDGWQDPAWSAVVPSGSTASYCKGPVAFVNPTAGDYRPLATQPAGSCDPCRMSTTGSYVGAKSCS